MKVDWPVDARACWSFQKRSFEHCKSLTTMPVDT